MLRTLSPSTTLRAALLAGICALLPVVPALGQSSPPPQVGGQGAQASSGSSGVVPELVAPEIDGGFTTIELASKTLVQLPMCLEYQIVGISLRMDWHFGVPYLFWTPHVVHYSPDMVSMGHVELDEIPYIELQVLFGSAYKFISNHLFATIMARLFGLPNNPIGGGRYQHKTWGEHQSVNFGENTVIGNPIAMFLEMFTFKRPPDADSGRSNFSGSGGGGGGWGSGATPQFNGSGGNGAARPQSGDGQVGAWFKAWIQDPDGTAFPTLFRDSMGYQEVMDLMANSQAVEAIKGIMDQINAALAGVGGRVGNSPFCPVNATPLEPYYLSGIDAYLWRLGYPVADSEKSLTILNPFSSDVVRPTLYKEGFEDHLIDLPEEVEALLTPRWGHIYPREGSLDDPNTARVQTVLAKRSQTLLGEDERPIGRIYKKPRYRIKSAAWSRIYPDFTMCRRNIANTTNEDLLENRGRYGWNVWTSHNCDLDRSGIHIMTVPLGPIYVTPPIPE